METDMEPEGIMEVMLKSKSNWGVVKKFGTRSLLPKRTKKGRSREQPYSDHQENKK